MKNESVELYEDLTGGARKVLKSAVKNYSKIISVVTLIALIAAIFAKLTFANVSVISGEFAVDMFVIMVLYYVMYFSTRATGIQDGKETTDYIDITARYSEIREKIRSDHEIENLWKYCQYYIAVELQAARQNILRAVSIPYSDWENKYSDLSFSVDDLPKQKRRAIKKVRRLKPLRLTPDLLLNRDAVERRVTPLAISPKKKLRISLVISMMPVTVMSLFVTSIIVDFIVAPTWETAVYAAFKILGILVVAFKGYNDGYGNIANFTVNYINTQISFICDYQKWFAKEQNETDSDAPVLSNGEGTEVFLNEKVQSSP